MIGYIKYFSGRYESEAVVIITSSLMQMSNVNIIGYYSALDSPPFCNCVSRRIKETAIAQGDTWRSSKRRLAIITGLRYTIAHVHNERISLPDA